MPDIAKGREKVNAFLKDKGIKKTTLAVAYGFKRQEVTNILSGTTKGPRANSFILQVIEDYGIEQEWDMNELKIRKDCIYLNNQKLKGVQAIKTKSTAESNHATVYLKFTAKLI